VKPQCNDICARARVDEARTFMGETACSYFAFGPSSVLGPRAADDALLLRLQRTGVRSSRRGQVGGLDQQER